MPSISACHLVLAAIVAYEFAMVFWTGTWYQDGQWSAETCAQLGSPWDNFPLSKSRATTMEIFTIPRKMIPSFILDLHMFFNSWKTLRANSSNSSNWMHVRIVTCSYICQDGYLDEIQEKTIGWKLEKGDVHADMFGISTFCRISSMNSIVDEDMGYINIR